MGAVVQPMGNNINVRAGNGAVQGAFQQMGGVVHRPIGNNINIQAGNGAFAPGGGMGRRPQVGVEQRQARGQGGGWLGQFEQRRGGYGRAPAGNHIPAQRRGQFPHNHGVVQAEYDPDMTLDTVLANGVPWGSAGSSQERKEQPNPRENYGLQGTHNRGAGWHPTFPEQNAGSRTGTWNFTNPTDSHGEFARAMSQITCDPSSTAQGSLSQSNHLNNQLSEQIQMALAVNLGLNGPQVVKERALHNVLTSKTARGDMKQILQSRAEIYGDNLDPN